MKQYHCIGEIQRPGSPMSRDIWNWDPATIEEHQKHLNDAAGPEGWGRFGYKVNYCIAIGVHDQQDRVELTPQREAL